MISPAPLKIAIYRPQADPKLSPNMPHPAFQTKLQAIRGDSAELEELRLQVMHGAGILDLQADLKAPKYCYLRVVREVN